MQIKVNGQLKEIEKGINILQLLEIQQVKMPEMVSVEINGEILDRDDFEKTILQENDEVEFIYFMGGGALEF
ncbi:MAG: sulfur carrier protein ThiS [Bacillota bacterium]